MTITSELIAPKVLAPLATPLPPPPKDEPFTAAQWNTLMSIMDTVIPSIQRESSGLSETKVLMIKDGEYNKMVAHVKEKVVEVPSEEALQAYFEESASSNQAFVDLLKRMLMHYVKDDQRKALGFVLSALGTRAGSLLLTGYVTPISEQTIPVRTAILKSWARHTLPPLRVLYKQFTFLGKSIFLKSSTTFAAMTGYPHFPDSYSPGKGYDYRFLQFPSAPKGVKDAPVIIEYDVVIVGSGCGGGVCAKNLAEAGHSVLVVDKSYYHPPEALPMSEPAGSLHLFEAGGVDSTDDGSLSVLSGSCWGGGGSINWSASLQTQGFVRKEWAEDRKLPFFGSEEFQTCLDRVCDRMGVSDKHIRHNHGNQVLLEAARKLGYTAKAVPQNTGGAEHYCGHCAQGCGSAEKQGPANSWLPDAARAGAHFVEGLEVEKVVFKENGGVKKAVGIRGVWTSRSGDGGLDGPFEQRVKRRVVVKARKVIVSAGSLWSPIVLLNSGLKNKHIGRNLYMHPVNLVFGIYKEETRPWEGGILTSVCSSFENLDGHGHGIKLERTCMLPSLSLVMLNWDSGLDWKLLTTKYRHLEGFIGIARDRDTGRVYRDASCGKPRIAYTPSKLDKAHCLKSVVEMCKMTLTGGAREIHVAIAGTTPYLVDPLDENPSIADPRFVEWLDGVVKVGNEPPGGIYPSAHQMGSNRMAYRADLGVVDPKGKVWGTEGCFVADASVFPSASGVNPMVTNMAISDMISRGIAHELDVEKGRISRL